MINKKNIFIIKFCLTIAICVWLFDRAEWQKIADQILQIDTFVIVSALFFMMLSVAISAYKWKMMLAMHGINYKFPALHKYYYIASFFNNFLPTSIGGDGYRIYKTLDNSRSKMSAVFAILMERVTGLFVLLLLAYLSSLLLYISEPSIFVESFVLLGGGIGLISLISLFVMFEYRGALSVLVPNKIKGLLKEMPNLIDDYKGKRKSITSISLVTIIFHINNCLAFFVILNFGLDNSINLAQMLLIMAMFNLASLLPIAINGIGVIDGAFIYFSGLFGVPFDEGLLTMLIMRALLLIISGIGIILFFVREGERVAELKDKI